MSFADDLEVVSLTPTSRAVDEEVMNLCSSRGIEVEGLDMLRSMPQRFVASAQRFLSPMEWHEHPNFA